VACAGSERPVDRTLTPIGPRDHYDGGRVIKLSQSAQLSEPEVSNTSSGRCDDVLGYFAPTGEPRSVFLAAPGHQGPQFNHRDGSVSLLG
jgi:hypothetical protein